jgi:hypothetical protein
MLMVAIGFVLVTVALRVIDRVQMRRLGARA